MPNTLEENVNRIKAAKTAIANAITAKGGTIASGDGLEDFANDIATIPSGGGGVDTPSGDAHFSLFLCNDPDEYVYAYINSDSGEYQIPSVQAMHDANIIILITPVKTITNHSVIGDLRAEVHFSPASDFSLNFETQGDEITAGDGKIYSLYYYNGVYNIVKHDVDLFVSLT